MEAMQGQPVEERINATGSAEGACTAVMDWYQPRGDAERDHHGRDLNNIAMQRSEDPHLFFARVEGKLNVLSALGIHTSDREVVGLINRHLPSDWYDVEQRASLLRPGVTRTDIMKLLRVWYACLLYTSPSPRDRQKSRMPSSA